MAIDAYNAQVLVTQRPFEGARAYELAGGRSLAALLEEISDDLPPTWREDFVVMIDGRVVPFEIWDDTIPCESSIVSVALSLDGKGTLRVFAQLAILGVATAVSAGALGPAGLALGGASWAAGGTSAAFAGAALPSTGPLLLTLRAR